MNYQEMEQLVHLQLKEVEKCQSRKEEEHIFFSLAGYFLGCAVEEGQMFQETDVLLLRRALLRVAGLSQKLLHVYEKYKEPLWEAYKKMADRVEQNLVGLEQEKKWIAELEDEQLRVYEELKAEEAVISRMEAELEADTLKMKQLRQKKEGLEKELITIKHKNENFEKDMEDMSKQIIEAQEIHQELEAYFLENESLKKAISEAGYVDREGFMKKLHEMKQQGTEIMSAYDVILKNMLEDGEKLQKRVKERQRR